MITTVQQHILQQQQEISEASGRFSWLLSGITLAAKMVEAKIRTAGLSDVLGAQGATNVQGEQQQKLDVYANQALLHCLGLRDSVAALVSEEDEEPVTFDRSVETGKYIICGLWAVHGAGLYHRPRGAWVHARPHHRRVRSHQRAYEDAAAGKLLQRQ